MHVVTSNIFDKTNVALTSAVRNASCDHGWLRIVVECIFGILTVASFVLIVIMALKSTNQGPFVGPFCKLQGCRVVCTDIPFFGEHEEFISSAISAAETNCERVFLTLNGPTFENATLPPKWLSGRLRSSNIHELGIVGGNLRYIAGQAFMSRFTSNIRHLVLENVTINTWESDTLVGLSNLEDLCISNTVFHNIKRNALEAVDNTLKTLVITSSGRWNPVNLTGTSRFEQLTTVVLSSNDFGNVLNKRSFSRLRYCKKLYLNSCGITAISTGAFDYFDEIEVIFLNNNYLITIAPGLFDRLYYIGSPKVRRPRVNLQDNLLLCDCSAYDLRRLSDEGLMLVDPVCHYPDAQRGKYLSYFSNKCNSSVPKLLDTNRSFTNLSQLIYVNGTCTTNPVISSVKSMKVSSTLSMQKCSVQVLGAFDLVSLSSARYIFSSDHSNNRHIKPTFALRSGDVSMVELSSAGSNDYGLLWFQSKCPTEIYCISVLPNFLRVYNVDETSLYTFCPLKIRSGAVDSEQCVSYSMLATSRVMLSLRILMFLSMAAVCLVIGATCVYGIIRKYPSLLKGSKRILFVKHKTVDALILPPKVPLRSNLLSNETVPNINENEIFILPNNTKCVSSHTFMRSKSTRSNNSTAPSYISALEPTEDQLTEWRLQHHFDNTSTVTSLSLDACSWVADDNSIYYSLNQNSNRIYESLK